MTMTLGFSPQTGQSYEDWLKQQQGILQPVPPGQKTTEPITVGGTIAQVPPGQNPYPMTVGAPPTAPTGTDANPFSPQKINTALTDLNFGKLPTPIAPPTLAPTAPAQAGQVDWSHVPTASGGTASGASASAASVAPPPSVVAPQVKAEQGGFADFQALQDALYHSNFDPQQRELQRQQGLADQQLNATLAQRGLAESGTGVGQLVRQDQEFMRQMTAAASDSAQRAAVQRYGMEYTQSMDNAKMRQEANLANAGFTLTASVENAKNLLTANITTAQLKTQASIASAANQTQASIASAQNQTAASVANAQIGGQLAGQQAALATQANIANANNASAQAIAQGQLYVQTMGLNVQQETAARQQYLQLLGIQETDLARMDSFTLQNTSMMYDTYLKQLAILTQAGNVSFGKTDQSNSSGGFNFQLLPSQPGTAPAAAGGFQI